MPLDRLVLILVIVVLAAMATVWLGALVAASASFPFGLALLLPASLLAYVIWRVVADRIRSRDDDHYDRME
ncbi:hypothetical protein JSE7799_00817 [Jannaschia seosinensis]|uniref:Uncharacterized protein n=1 Tax=Jannaschia seosinensis TaxID=313367 RepID=A0A0M7B8H3_9RHOB|nr:hypothetical protein [Jannaschia seosinensis]CUH28622.1 hypothetical protein JSE7799_00817 [Jannaschia seosinensis]